MHEITQEINMGPFWPMLCIRREVLKKDFYAKSEKGKKGFVMIKNKLIEE